MSLTLNSIDIVPELQISSQLCSSNKVQKSPFRINYSTIFDFMAEYSHEEMDKITQMTPPIQASALLILKIKFLKDAKFLAPSVIKGFEKTCSVYALMEVA